MSQPVPGIGFKLGAASPKGERPPIRFPMARPKTGCLTCSRRKIKCDEPKPNCSHCIKSRLPCVWPAEASKAFDKEEKEDKEAANQGLSFDANDIAAARATVLKVLCQQNETPEQPPALPRQQPISSTKRQKLSQLDKRATPGRVSTTPYFTSSGYDQKYTAPPDEYKPPALCAEGNQQTPVVPAKHLYLAYGTELVPSKMTKLYPSAQFLGLAKLDGYKIFLTESGEASCMAASHFSYFKGTCVVWGLVYRVSELDLAEIERQGKSNERNQTLLYLPMTQFTAPNLGWTARAKEEDLTDKAVENVNVLVSCDPENTRGFGNLSMESIFAGVCCDLEHSKDSETIGRFNAAITILDREWRPCDYINESLRPWVPLPI
ncbi:Zn2/Cys6 DNA-binding protein [Glarea lozoyensis ATCC 20868]|uniref:Zn2/Cys6 DNA-binding protein n=1 Tax=Glarea lozoyensis (strain ATCC 20868 / MF5171) TaxID=1116229 RepID=S3D4Q7_GLAL2|nr:Zn2/Cys6 DNA-binding protein [Glarea lozoyensis ATCC 20868]EPE32765.1 Zn2/Cys6 DNA-binding protein [Glarea lozoyensis ATCC 20868]